MNGLDRQAGWIWCNGEKNPKNFTLDIRRSFFLPAPVRNGSIRVTADSRYRLSVNGTWVARGKIPTPHGPVAVEWRTGQEFSLICSVPAPARVIVPRMNEGTVSATELHGIVQPDSARTPDSEGRITVLLKKAGEYRIISR